MKRPNLQASRLNRLDDASSEERRETDIMRKGQTGITTIVSEVLISISASESLASQKKARPGTIVQNGGQTRRRVGVTGNGSRGKALQEKMQNENRQVKQPTSVEYPNLRGTRRNADSGKRRRATNSVVERDLDQPDMAASKNEVSVESRKKTPTSTRQRSSFMPEVDDEVLLRERGQPHKQPPTRRGPHKQPPTRRGPHKMP
jgi:hypothetical protein